MRKRNIWHYFRRKSTVRTRKDQRELQILEDHKRSVNSSRNSLIQSYMNNQNNQSGESLLYQQNNRSVTSVTSSKNKSLPLPLHLHHQQDQPLILQIHISPKSQFLGRTKQTHLLVLYQRHKLFQNTQTKEVQLCTVVLGFIIHQYFNQTTTFPLRKFKIARTRIQMAMKRNQTALRCEIRVLIAIQEFCLL